MKQKDLIKELTYNKVKQMYLEKEYTFFEKPMSLNIFGLRVETGTNKYDDLIGVAYIDPNAKEEERNTLKLYPATTDAGKYWLEHPMNKKGTAILVAGQYSGSHMIGNHNGYSALVQKYSMKVYRDNDKDTVHDMLPETIESGNFGINIHRSHPFIETYDVNKYSAGCQVFMNSAEFDELMSLCWKQSSIKGMGNSFTYTLFDLSNSSTVVKSEEQKAEELKNEENQKSEALKKEEKEKAEALKKEEQEKAEALKKQEQEKAEELRKEEEAKLLAEEEKSNIENQSDSEERKSEINENDSEEDKSEENQ